MTNVRLILLLAALLSGCASDREHHPPPITGSICDDPAVPDQNCHEVDKRSLPHGR